VFYQGYSPDYLSSVITNNKASKINEFNFHLLSHFIFVRKSLWLELLLVSKELDFQQGFEHEIVSLRLYHNQ